MELQGATVTFSRTIKTADYESKKVEVVLTGVVRDGDEVFALGLAAHQQAMMMLGLDDAGSREVAAPKPKVVAVAEVLPPTSLTGGAPTEVKPVIMIGEAHPSPSVYTDEAIADLLRRRAAELRDTQVIVALLKEYAPTASAIPMDKRADFVTRLKALGANGGAGASIPL